MNEQQIEERVDVLVRQHMERINQRMVEYGIPSHMHAGVQRYMEHGLPPGGFLSAVLSNNLTGAAVRADAENARCLCEWGRFTTHALPALAHGSPDVVDRWLAFGGLRGLLRQDFAVEDN